MRLSKSGGKKSRFITIGGAIFGAGIANEKSPEPSKNLNDPPARGCTLSVSRWPSRVTAAVTDRPATRLLDEPRELSRAAHAFAIEFDDDIAGPEAGFLRRAVGFDIFDHDPGRDLAGLQFVIVEVTDGHADLGAPTTEHPGDLRHLVIPVPALGLPGHERPCSHGAKRDHSRGRHNPASHLLILFLGLASIDRRQTHPFRKRLCGRRPAWRSVSVRVQGRSWEHGVRKH